MTHIMKIKSGSKFEEIASYSRAVVVDNWIFVSNTAGRNPLTGEMPDDIFEQTEQIFINIDRALISAGSCMADVISAKVFIQDPSHVSSVMEFFGGKFKDIDPVVTVTCPPLGSTIYKVEIEVTAYRGASKLDAERIHIS
ncbi:RidA family protein [Vibrio salinus]|uniref:RidA family protein n=1 Tax=Vibrio salinus TaxID=2899784 RepID=UPI001E38B361|nr:RidA family protein [Vibrio salinus]MCE0494815.1 RidA family protein [Vibrio salinus]